MFRVGDSLSVCLSASVSPAFLSLLSSGLPSQGSEPLTLSAPSLPTAELAQEHLGELHQVSSRLWVGAAAELSSCVVSQASAGSLQRQLGWGGGQGSQMGPETEEIRRGEKPPGCQSLPEVSEHRGLELGIGNTFCLLCLMESEVPGSSAASLLTHTRVCVCVDPRLDPPDVSSLT